MAAVAAGAAQNASRGQRWGEGIARCFSLTEDFMDEDAGVRLQPIPDSFMCPISLSIMEDPVATVDGAVYDRGYIEQWIRSCRQRRQEITSPATGLALPSASLISLEALKRAIETYIAHRPELNSVFAAKRSLEEAASLVQAELLEKQTVNASIQDELSSLLAKLEAADADRQALEILVVDNKLVQDELRQQLSTSEAAVCDSKESLHAEEAAHRDTLVKLADVSAQLATTKAMRRNTVPPLPKKQALLSCAAFMHMAACTKARLPHIVPPPPPLQTLTNCPWWKESEYFEASLLTEFCGNLNHLVQACNTKLSALTSSGLANSTVAGCYCNVIGRALMWLQGAESARPYIQRALGVFESRVGYERDREVSHCLLNRLDNRFNATHPDFAGDDGEDLVLRVTALCETCPGWIEPVLLETVYSFLCFSVLCSRFANVRTLALEYVEALACARDNFARIYGENDVSVAICSYHIGRIPVEVPREAGEAELRRAVKIFTNLYKGRPHRYLADALRTLGDYLANPTNPKASEEGSTMLKMAADMYEHIFGRDHPETCAAYKLFEEADARIRR